MKLKVELEGRDFIEIECSEEGRTQSVSILGCADFMNLMQEQRKIHGNDISTWPLPTRVDHSSLLLKEMILKLKGQWTFPYSEEEVCHCRNISAAAVDQAIVAGAHSTEAVTRQTSACSACGTCRPEVQKIIDYRLGRSS